MRKFAQARTIGGICLAAIACGGVASCDGSATPNNTSALTEEARPEPVNGWIELPLADKTIKTQPEKWRTDVIEIPVWADGGDLEYKLEMAEGDGVVYSVTYEDLESPDLFEVEFHGHTEKGPDGIGDLMFYSVTNGTPESGAFTAPFDGIHGWYLHNKSARDVTVRLELAGYYTLKGETPISGEPAE